MKVPVHSVYNTMYCGELTLGGEENIFLTVFFDTSSSDFWLPSSDCKASSKWCRNHRRYNHRESSTYEDAQRNFTSTFGGQLVKGRVSMEQMTFGDTVLTQQLFGEAISMPDEFQNIPFSAQYLYDGVIGLGFSREASTGTPILLNKSFPNKIFSFSLFKSAQASVEVVGELIIGEVDKARYSGEMVWSPVTSDNAWQVTMDSISIGKVSLCLGECQVVANTSMAAIVGPKAQVETLFEVLNAKDLGGVIVRSVECEMVPYFPDLVFGMGDQIVKISPVDYTEVQSFAGLDDMCFLKIVTLEDGEDDKWVLGAMAHKPLYIVYDHENVRLGFSQSI